MPLLTVFTPSYNRAHTLPRVFESLCRQTCKDLEWFIIDDGSTDNTKEIVAPWLASENGFPIRYYYKENGGLHTTYNCAIEHMTDSILAVCIDSDDYMPDNAVERIKSLWLSRGGEQYGGIIGLDYDTDHNLLGGLLPGAEIDSIAFSFGRYKVKAGDKKYVCRTDLYKAVFPQPVFEGERFFNPSWLNQEVGRRCRNFLVLNEEICTVDYQPGGLSKNKLKQYYNSPNGYMNIRKQTLSFEDVPFKVKVRTILHYDAEALLAGCFGREFRQSGDKLLMLLILPAGWMLKKYITNHAGESK